MFNRFLDFSDINHETFKQVLFKKNLPNNLKNKNIGLLFEKPSTRTRISFLVGINQLGGNAIDIKFDDLNFSRSETFQDTFKALNCYLDGLIYRTSQHKNLEVASKFFKKPIINALSERSHPCQAISDIYTLNEHFGKLNLNLLWMGDLSNVCFSLIQAAHFIKELKITVCSHKDFISNCSWKISDNVKFIDDLKNFDFGECDCVMTDVFISMNDKDNDKKIENLKSYQVNSAIMDKTNDKCIFMHCLPAKVGFEVTEDVLNGPKSIVWHQAKNKMITQKKILQSINW